mmetsp:Transcript_8544/g.19015  ORF Transcript_8544/g.19015 Transcript_8544/m.19015 type:complete len:174 (+) Transcript_8544:132-653(+)
MPGFKGDSLKGTGKGKKGGKDAGIHSDSWRRDNYWAPSTGGSHYDQAYNSRGKGRPRGDTPPKSDDSGNTGDTLDTVSSFMLDERLRKMNNEFMKAITAMSDKNSEKFNLIFNILNELQTRQAKLMDDVKSLEASVEEQNQTQAQQQWDQGCNNMGQMVWTMSGSEQSNMWQG